LVDCRAESILFRSSSATFVILAYDKYIRLVHFQAIKFSAIEV